MRTCECVCMFECFMTLSSTDEREEVSSVIYSHRPSCPICVSHHRFALSHTHLPSLSHFSQPPSFAPRALPPRPLLICLCVSDNSRSCCISLHPSPLQVSNLEEALKHDSQRLWLDVDTNSNETTRETHRAENCN